MRYQSLKRTGDGVGAVAGLVVLALPMLAIAVAVRVAMGGPVLFRQMRPGAGSKPFMLLKFRTMRDAYDPQGCPLPDGQRITRLGKVLRTTSLDELPELWNVLKGDMSLVGPRPLLMQYLDRYTPQQARRHEVRPGITGWAQVNGRNAISWERTFELDVWYVDHASFRLDVKILLMSIAVVARHRGTCAEGHPTAQEFMGIEGACKGDS